MGLIFSTILKRLALGVMTLLVVSVIIFSGMSMLPGDFSQAILGQAATEETVAAFRKEIGLDRPPVLRYFDWIGAVLQGDLGTSFSGRTQTGQTEAREVADLVGPRLWNTLFLASVTATIAVPISLVLGITTALYRNSAYDRTVNTVTLTTISFPEFFVAYILILFLSSLYSVFPSLANVDADTQFSERIYRAALPALTLTLVIVAHMMRMTRAAIINLLASPYIEMARLKGMSPISSRMHCRMPGRPSRQSWHSTWPTWLSVSLWLRLSLSIRALASCSWIVLRFAIFQWFRPAA